jgi:hypothetical protein
MILCISVLLFTVYYRIQLYRGIEVSVYPSINNTHMSDYAIQNVQTDTSHR